MAENVFFSGNSNRKSEEHLTMARITARKFRRGHAKVRHIQLEINYIDSNQNSIVINNLKIKRKIEISKYESQSSEDRSTTNFQNMCTIYSSDNG